MVKKLIINKYTKLLTAGIIMLFIVACSSSKTMEREDVADAFLNEEYKQLYNQTSKQFQNEVTMEEFKDIGNKFNEGVDGYLFQSELLMGNNITQYTWVNEEETRGIIAHFDDKDTIIGIQAVPLEGYQDTDDIYTETTFQLPFENEWFVFWGGSNKLVNYHYDFEGQRYAFDFLILKDASSYDGDPAKNESYYAFGQNMMAPADGVVVEVENEIADNEPVGEMNAEEPFGNYVIIDHGNDEYSFLAHFKQGSILVEKGDEIKANDILGLVGNSGNSSEPHIHFHVADSPDIDESTSIRIDLGEKDLIQGDFVTP